LRHSICSKSERWVEARGAAGGKIARQQYHLPTRRVDCGLLPAGSNHRSHFGAGFFCEALMAAESAQSRSEPSQFGTDSSFFPRGWRRVIVGAQRALLNELGVEPEAQAKIFAGNFECLFSVPQR
jgi:hypothetical protein